MREGVVALVPIRQATAPAICRLWALAVAAAPMRSIGPLRMQQAFFGLVGQKRIRKMHETPLAFATVVEQQRFLQQFDFALVVLVNVVEQSAKFAAHFVKTRLFPFTDVVQLR